MITHNAPPVVYPLGRSAFLAAVLCVLWLAGLALAVAWLHSSRSGVWMIVAVFTSVVGGGLAAYTGWKNSPVGTLAWDGQGWRWESQGYQAGVAEQQLSVIADFQHVLLLRIENQAHASMWLWSERQSAPERWMDFRRGVWSPERSARNTGPQDPTGEKNKADMVRPVSGAPLPTRSAGVKS